MPVWLQILSGLTAILTVWVGWAKVVGPRIKRAWSRGVGFFQTIAGRDPIIDKITGKEVAPAVPPLGEQMASINDTMGKLVAVIESNQDAHHRIDNHETRLVVLEEGRVERIVAQAESAQMWRAVANENEKP